MTIVSIASRWLGAVLLVFSISGCCSSGIHTMTSHHDDAAILASAKADIDAANQAWLPGLRNRDAQSIVAAYADDGLFIAHDGTATRGREAIAAMYTQRFTRLREILGGGVVPDGLTVVSPALIYEWGHAWIEMAPEKAGQPTVRSGGSYLTVWQRGDDGHWRITRNIAI
jgi:uncharacterized protein (TIGR02246 family)